MYLRLYFTYAVGNFSDTRPKPVGHGYVFSMAVGTIGELFKLVPFLLGDEGFILRGGYT